ncbi:ATP-binding protein [Actinoplanes subtropicus]|uniref:ATP-binding protein n=1 Tax=Actinoplanes subtropicus TaxID=543632 RepID=UPI0004C427E9|nr:ATP-binding protein [Actinoplanes subtropicus]
MNLQRRVAGGFALLCAMFLALVLLQLVAGDRVRAGHEQRIGRLDRLLDGNRRVLQDMTDAETGVRGFQLTGEPAYLSPYESGSREAFAALDDLDADATSTAVRGLTRAERAAAKRWLDAYGIPIVGAGVADADPELAASGKRMFDELRAANGTLDRALEAERTTEVAAGRRDAHRIELLFGVLAGLVLLTAFGIAGLHQRHLLRPLEHIRHTLRRLADGDRSARARPAGPREMRAVIGTLNDLAAETERLITAERARGLLGELRQRIATELRRDQDFEEKGRRVAEILVEALRGDAAYGQVSVGRGAGLAVCWPPDAPPLDAELVRRIRSGRPGSVYELEAGLAVTLDGDDDCPPGLVLVTRAGGAGWTEDERVLLAGLCREIGHAVRQERLRLRQARLITELRLLDEQKDVFVSTVTHELRTPLTSILGYTEMLTDGDADGLSPVQLRSLDAILRNAGRLRDTVADLLLLDRANGRTGAEPAPVDLAAVLAGVHDDASTAARAKNVAGRLDATPVWVLGDGPRLATALRKLVDNAIKFTPAGGRFELRLSADGERATLTVTDTGMGIPADDLPGLFTPFHRAANAMDQAVQGPGLGLAIVRDIIVEHGGTVSARSEVGHGSVFTVTFPVLSASRVEVALS